MSKQKEIDSVMINYSSGVTRVYSGEVAVAIKGRMIDLMKYDVPVMIIDKESNRELHFKPKNIELIEVYYKEEEEENEKL